ncbi:hypothetical protein [Puia dinghuensis]|uniref:Collagen-like protein n=1 Tax=Puia dinghuensis TaxID=1792502 RepID=A0A8J2XVH3_9BACT|nr:hypothetical protein [Puia dinghuensis]GGB18496.1 hypothetical protein GCM10011511_47900 [Puia dinghuensis]
MKKLHFFYGLFFVITCALISCVKGDTGPAGPAGPAGADGANGADGAPGPDSVLYSSWMPVNMSSTIDAHSDTTYYQNFTADAITSNILNTGTIATYLETVDNQGNQLIFNAATALTETYYVGDIYVASLPPAASNSAGFNYSGYNYRFVVIPGAIATTMFKGMGPQQIKSMPYPAITKLLNLPANSSNVPKKLGSQ